MRDAKRADMMGSVDEHMQEVTVTGHRLVEGMTPGAEVPADSARVEQGERSVVVDGKAGDRPATSVRGVRVAAVRARNEPARSTLERGDR